MKKVLLTSAVIFCLVFFDDSFAHQGYAGETSILSTDNAIKSQTNLVINLNSGIENIFDCEYYHGDFEENRPIPTSTTHTVINCRDGDFTTIVVKPCAKKYTIGCLYYNYSKWNYSTADYINGRILTEGRVIDTVHIYPKGAQITTYTCDLSIGISGINDPGNHNLYYEYDIFGRLKAIKDQNGNILKTYLYHYKTS